MVGLFFKKRHNMFDEKNTETVLDVSNIEVVYNNIILVLRGVSLSVEKGGITALLGGNGAGKSTTLKSISNLLSSERGEVTKGSIAYNGDNIKDLNPADMVRRGVIHVMEVRVCFEIITVEDIFLRVAYTRYGGRGEFQECLEFLLGVVYLS